MARQEIDLTTPQPNGKMGEPTKSAWEKVNDMTEELYARQAGGIILASAEIGSTFSTGATSPVAVTGLTATVVAPDAPIMISWGGSIETLGGSPTDLFAVNLYRDGNVIAWLLCGKQSAVFPVHKEYLVTGLTPGQQYTFSLQANVGTNGTTLNLSGGLYDKFYLRVQSA